MAPKAASKGRAKGRAKAAAKVAARPRPRPIREATLAEGRLAPLQEPGVPFVLWATAEENRPVNEIMVGMYSLHVINGIAEFLANSKPDAVSYYLGIMLRYRPRLLSLVATRYITVADLNRVRIHMRVGAPLAVTPGGVVRALAAP